MRFRLLGNSGLRVSEMCLGTMTFSEDWGWGSGKDDCRKIYDTFREAGGNFFDTANFYTNGTSETLLGEFMQGHRESVALATKYSNAAPGKDANARTIEQLKDNLASLQVQLSTDQMARLNEVSKIDMGFPHTFFEKEMVHDFAFGGMKDAIEAA